MVVAAWSVFLSYVEATHDAETKALKADLEAAGIPTFRFKEDVPSGEPFGSVLADALLGSRVVVAFLDATFLDRPNCRWELNAVLAAGDLEARLVVARPVRDSIPNGLAGVPPAIANRRWPRANDTADLVALVRERLAANQPTLAEALGEPSASELRAQLLETSVLPPPELLTGIPHAPDPLPASIEDAFVGRSETLWRIDHALRLRHGLGARVRPTVALEGGGGTGKTRLAREYVRRYGSNYRGGIYWIDGTAQVDEQLHAVLRVIDPAVSDLVDLRKNGVDIVGYLRLSFDAHRPAAPVLWIVDGIPETSLRRHRPKRISSMESWCPLRGEVSLLVTSRVMVSAVSPSVERIPVQLLPGDAAIALLKRGVDDSALANEQWDAIASRVGRLPLALTLLNAALAAGALAAADLATRVSNDVAMTPLLEAAMKGLEKAGLADLEPGALRGVSEAFVMSYDLLDDEAQLLLRLLAQLAPDPIPEALLDGLGTSIAAAGARTALRTRSFIEPAAGQDIPAFGQIHVLLADFVRTVHEASVTELSLLGHTMVDLFNPDILELPSSWPLLNALVPHGTTLCNRPGGIGDGEDGDSASLLPLLVARVLLAQGSYTRARKLQEAELEERTRVLGSEHLETLIAANEVVITRLAQGDYLAAQELQDRVLEARTRLLGFEHVDTLTSADNAAIILYTRGDYGAARKLQEQVLEARNRLLGSEHLDTLRTANNLASTMNDQGDYAAARKLGESVLEARTRLLGPGHPNTLTAANNLASTMNDEGDYQAARKLLELVLARATDILGPEHPHTLAAAENLAITKRSQGDYPAARKVQEHVLEARTRLFGPQHPDTLTAGINLAGTMIRQGDYQAARKLLELVLARAIDILGPEHPHILAAAGDLAITMKAQGDYASAQQVEQQALEVRTRLFGSEHPDTLTAASNLAVTHFSQGDYPSARKLQERVVETRTRLFGSEHPDTRRAADSLDQIRWREDGRPG